MDLNTVNNNIWTRTIPLKCRWIPLKNMTEHWMSSLRRRNHWLILAILFRPFCFFLFFSLFFHKKQYRERYIGHTFTYLWLTKMSAYCDKVWTHSSINQMWTVNNSLKKIRIFIILVLFRKFHLSKYLTYLDFTLPFLAKIKNTCLNVTKFIVLIKEYLKFLNGLYDIIWSGAVYA
jgi:hypothetical protein